MSSKKRKLTPRDVNAAMKWADNHTDRDPANGTSWKNHCLASSRQMFGLPSVGPSAAALTARMEQHGRFLHRCKNPKDKGWWRDLPKAAWVLSDYGSYGHSWVRDGGPTDKAPLGRGWSTDYTTSGALKRCPIELPRWSSIVAATKFWICGVELNGVDYYIAGIECPFPKHEGRH